MKVPLIFLFSALALLAGCTGAERLERVQVSPPSTEDIVGIYSILEETATGSSPEEAKLQDARLELAADGTLRFMDFPIFVNAATLRGAYSRINESGRWILTSNLHGYYVTLFRENGDRLTSVVAEGGHPSDLIIYHGPRENGYFTKLRKL